MVFNRRYLFFFQETHQCVFFIKNNSDFHLWLYGFSSSLRAHVKMLLVTALLCLLWVICSSGSIFWCSSRAVLKLFGDGVYHYFQSFLAVLYTFFFYISNLVAKSLDLNLGEKLSNLLSNREALN